MSQSADKHRSPRRHTDTDTSSYEQVQGTPDRSEKPLAENPRQPHERDESARATGKHEKPARTGAGITQAAEDVERGRIDTERRGVPSDLPRNKLK